MPESANPESTAGLTSLPLFRRGKVRDVYDLGDHLLLVASDRISAFDVVLPSVIPGKGVLLTAISNLWFDHTSDVVPNHRAAMDIEALNLPNDEARGLEGRATIARKAERVDIECVVRGSIAGSGWKEYSAAGTLAGEPLPAGLVRGSELPEPRFTPAAKNDIGHDENITRADLARRVGEDLATKLERTSLALFERGQELAFKAGFTLADTKFEFGFVDGKLTLIDEVLTPDSSRYWDNGTWIPGEEPPSFDKQPVRDWLEASGWNKEPPGPALPESVIAATHQRYAEVLRRLTSIEGS
jgi:phosphoribosylaminoimidazole-succinocarboxamide synthase